jgi:formate hydrogenlyase subunit 3/multisubunit Na+/H+ antiporter MnhD subunit
MSLYNQQGNSGSYFSKLIIIMLWVAVAIQWFLSVWTGGTDIFGNWAPNGQWFLSGAVTVFFAMVITIVWFALLPGEIEEA